MDRVKRPRISSALWLVIGFVIAMLWGELFASVLMPQNLDTVLDILEPDPVAGYLYRPDAFLMERGRGYDVPFQINSIGLRDREIPAKTPGVFRVMLIGNSFSVSHGVAIEESFSRALENAMNRDRDSFAEYDRVEVINCSNAGYSAYNYWKGYTRWAPVLAPDLVIVGFVPGREHRCDADGTQYLVEDGLLLGRFGKDEEVVHPRRNPVRKVRKHLARSSNFYVLMRNYFYYNERIDRFLKRGDGVGEAKKSLQPYMVPLPTGIENGWARAYGHLERLHDETRRDGTDLVVVAIPERAHVDERHFANLRTRIGLDADQVDQDQPTKEVEKFCVQAGIAVIDLKAAVAEAHTKTNAYLPDNHWNSVGIAAGAEAVATQLMSEGRYPYREKTEVKTSIR